MIDNCYSKMTHKWYENFSQNCCSKLACKHYSKSTRNYDSKSDHQTLLKKCSSTLFKTAPQALLKIYPQLLLKKLFANFTQNRHKIVTKDWLTNIFENRTGTVQLLSKIDPRMLLKSWSPNVTQKVIQKRYSKLADKLYSKKSYQCY